MNRSRTRWLVTALSIFGVCAGLSVYWAFTGRFGDSLLLGGSAWSRWTVSIIVAALLIGLLASRRHDSRLSMVRHGSDRSARAVAHVQATIRRRD